MDVRTKTSPQGGDSGAIMFEKNVASYQGSCGLPAVNLRPKYDAPLMFDQALSKNSYQETQKHRKILSSTRERGHQHPQI